MPSPCASPDRRRAQRSLVWAAAFALAAVTVECASGVTTVVVGPPLGGVVVQVSVDASKLLEPITETSFGVNVGVFDEFLDGDDVPDRLREAGLRVLRYPDGIPSDLYHWQTHTLTPDVEPRFWLAPNATFDNFMELVHDANANALITVNYGTNADGTGGGDPAEAAAWVEYANVTKQYGIKYWEIGNEIYGNGIYGTAWMPDLHDDRSPAGYAKHALEFVEAMRAKDPSIQLGIPLVLPGQWPDGAAPDWNGTVLPALCEQVDFVVVHWYPQQPGTEHDATLLGSTQVIAERMSALRALLTEHCGARADRIGVWVTETNSSLPPGSRQQISMVGALFIADAYLTWLRHGALNVSWETLHNGPQADESPKVFGSTDYGDWGLLANGTCSDYLDDRHWPTGNPSSAPPCAPPRDTPYRTWHGLHMTTRLGGPGDHLVASASSDPLVAVHAVAQQDGELAVLLINKSPDTAVDVAVSLAGFQPSGNAAVHGYGVSDDALTETTGIDLATPFFVNLAPYSLNTLVLEPRAD